MSGVATPPLLLEPIASDAGSAFITNPMPDAPTGTNAASVQGGFPPITMQEELAGGKPPLGPDMNGLFYLVSSHTAFVQAGQPYLFNSTLATALGGYKLGTILGMSDESGVWLNILDGNTSNPDTGGAGWAPFYSYGQGIVNGLTNANVTLSATQYKKQFIVLNGALTGNVSIIFPALQERWLVINNCTGAFNVTARTAGGTGIVIPAGGFGSPTGVYCDGANIRPAVAPLAVPIDQAPNPLTIVERTNSGYILGVYFNQSSGLENPSVGSVFVQNTAADGFLRKISLTNFEAQLLLQGLGGQVVNGQVPLSAVAQWAASIFANAALTGNPTTPTQAVATNNTRIASTAFVQAALASGLSTGTIGHFQIGPFLINWGTHISASTGPEAVVFDQPFPNLCVGIYPASGLPQHTTSVSDPAASKTGFSLTAGVSASPTYWHAIGY